MPSKLSYEKLDQKNKELSKSKEKLDSILNSMDDLIFIFDKDIKFIDYFQPSTNHELFVPPEEFIGKSFIDVLPQHVISLMEIAINALKTTGDSQQFSYSLETSGVERLYSTKLSMRIDSFDEFAGVTAIVRDITSLKWTNEAQVEFEGKYRQLFNTETDALMLFDAETRGYIDVNESALSLYGYSREEFLQKKHQDITAEPEQSDETIKLLLEGKLTHIPVRYHRKKDGTIFPVEISASYIELNGQKIVCGAIRDITERLKVEEGLKEAQNELENKIVARTAELSKSNKALAASQKLYDSIIKAIPEIIYRIDEDGYITFISEAIKAYGYRVEDLLGKKIFDFIYPPDVDKVIYKIRERRKEDRNVDSFEVRLLTKADNVVPFEVFSVSAVGLYLPGDSESMNFIGTQGVARDITEKKRADEEREKLINDLREALDKVKTLKGLVPICSMCKKIRDDKGFWNIIEDYIEQHSDALFSHGMCPDCMTELYKDEDWYKKKFDKE